MKTVRKAVVRAEHIRADNSPAQTMLSLREWVIIRNRVPSIRCFWSAGDPLGVSLGGLAREDSVEIPARTKVALRNIENDLGERNKVDPPTCFVTITASASGVKAGRLDPGAIDGPLTVDVFGSATVGLNAILSDHNDSLALGKLINLIL